MQMAGDLMETQFVTGQRTGDCTFCIAARHIGHDLGELGHDRRTAERLNEVCGSDAGYPDSASRQVGEFDEGAFAKNDSKSVLLFSSASSSCWE